MPCVPACRTLLFVPGDRPDLLVKADRVAADALVIDWEDAVRAGSKAAARGATLDWLRAAADRDRARAAHADADDRGARSRYIVRINGVQSAAFARDCDALAHAPPVGVMLSKCETAEAVVQMLARVRHERPCAYPLIESARGLLNAAAIAAAPGVAAVAFGAEDFTADCGIVRGEDDAELQYARAALVVACRAAGVEAIDAPCLAYRDPDVTRRAAQRARRLGFAGTLVIHPSQIAIGNAAFTPTAQEVAEAARILDRWHTQQAGAFGDAGALIDQAVARRAEGIVARAARAAPTPQE